MKDIRIFIASSKELIRERNYLAFFVVAHVERVRKAIIARSTCGRELAIVAVA